MRDNRKRFDRIMAHGGLFKTKEVGQKILAAALNAPITVMETAEQGGSWGIALLAQYMISGNGKSLEDWLEQEVFSGEQGNMNMDLVMYGLDGLPRWGMSVFGTEYRYAAGGKGANQAFAAARQGADCYMVGRVGNDENGRSLLGSLEQSGVHTQYVVTDPVLNTGLSTMNMGEEGNYYSIYVPGANTAMCIRDLETAMEGNQFDMIVMQLEMPQELVFYICKLGKQTGIPVFLDAGPAMQIPLCKLEGAFIISPNEAETKALTGIVPDTQEHVLEAAEKIYTEARPKHVILKLGKRGAFLYSDKIRERIPGFQVQAVDTTAAGDTFGAAFCVQYCMGKAVAEAIRYAHAAAAICVTRKGGQPSIPTMEETEQFYQENNYAKGRC